MRFIITLLLATSIANANGESHFYSKSSLPEKNLLLEVFAEDKRMNKTNILSDMRLFFCITSTKPILEGRILAYFPKDDYFCKVTLIDAQGNIVPKTKKGQQLGSLFSALEEFSLDVINKVGSGGTGANRPDRTIILHDKCSTRYFFAPEELFEIKHSGAYRLLLEFQVFKMTEHGRMDYEFDLVRFKPIEIEVIKE